MVDQLANLLKQLTGVISSVEPLDQLLKLLKLVQLICATSLVEILNQLTNLVGELTKAAKVTHLIKLIEIINQCAELSGLVDLVHHQTKLPHQLIGLVSISRRFGLVVLNRLQQQALLLAHRVLAHCKSCHGGQGHRGYRYGSRGPHVRPTA